MPNHSSDLHDSDVPLLARFVYELYPYDALSFEIESIQKMIDRISELYPDSNPQENGRQLQILTLQIAIKYCQQAENLGAIAIAFKYTYDDEKKEILGIYKKLAPSLSNLLRV